LHKKRKRENKGSNFNPKYVCILLCSNLSPYYFSVILDYMFIPKSTGEGMSNPRWQQMVLDDMIVLDTSGI